MAGLTALAGTVSPAIPSLQREDMLGEGGMPGCSWEPDTSLFALFLLFQSGAFRFFFR